MPRYGRRKTYRRSTKSTGRSRSSRSSSSRTTYRRRKYSKVSRKWPLWKNPLPQNAYYKLTYQDSGFPFATNIGSAYLSTRQWRGNSCFDPDYTGFGSQPYGYDKLCGADCAFQVYQVYASKITVYPHLYTAELPEADAIGNYCVRISLYPSRSPTITYKEFEDLNQIPYCTRRLIESSNDVNKANILSKYCSTRMVLPDALNLASYGYEAAYNADPVLPWFWNVTMDSIEFANDVSGYFDVKIKYYVMLVRNDDVNEP